MKYVLFDLDGTIIDTLEGLKCAVNHALSQYNYPLRTLNEIRLFIGNGVQKLLQRSLDKRTIFPSPYEIYNKTEFIEYQIKMGYFNKNDNIFKFKEVEKSRFNFDTITCNTEEEKIEKDSINDFDEINTLIMKEIKSNL